MIALKHETALKLCFTIMIYHIDFRVVNASRELPSVEQYFAQSDAH
jgi:hypothetical protein